MYQFGELLVLGFLIAIPIGGSIAVGVFLMYSAITGRGLEAPGRGAMWELHVWYALRGLFGIGFMIMGVLMIVGIVVSW